jgi:hypothetical protein
VHAPQLWSLLSAREDPAGRLLLAFRDAWRHSLCTSDDPASDAECEAASIRARESIVVREDDTTVSLAVPVPGAAPPIAALAVRGGIDDVIRTTRMLAAAAHRVGTAVAAEA